jgi:hypothetical protein
MRGASGLTLFLFYLDANSIKTFPRLKKRDIPSSSERTSSSSRPNAVCIVQY